MMKVDVFVVAALSNLHMILTLQCDYANIHLKVFRCQICHKEDHLSLRKAVFIEVAPQKNNNVFLSLKLKYLNNKSDNNIAVVGK